MEIWDILAYCWHKVRGQNKGLYKTPIKGFTKQITKKDQDFVSNSITKFMMIRKSELKTLKFHKQEVEEMRF